MNRRTKAMISAALLTLFWISPARAVIETVNLPVKGERSAATNGNTSSGTATTVGGGVSNTASANHATVSGGDGNTASGLNASIGGGLDNTASNTRSTVGGGHLNTASGFKSIIGGGFLNIASGTCATVGGGDLNEAQALYSTIAGGGPSDMTNQTTKQNTRNLVTDDYGTIGGGGENQAGDNAGTATDAQFATVAGGRNNTASGSSSSILGGQANTASALQSSVGGGAFNTASGAQATIPGGVFNSASGDAAIVAGGVANVASGLRSFAAGAFATASHAGAFVWGDSTTTTIASTAADQVTFQASGGMRVYTNSGATAGVTIAAGAGAWVTVSDENMKENIESINPEAVLEKIVEMPLTEWNYKAQSQDIRHIGPMAQDFHAAFGLGSDPLGISTQDAEGVALAAIQGLNMKLVAKGRRIDELEVRLAALEQLLLNADPVE